MDIEIIWKLDEERLSEAQRIRLLRKVQADDNVIDYLKWRLKKLWIVLDSDLPHSEGNIMDMMEYNRLAGWCWQTTESAIVFFQDDDYIERGNLTFSPTRKYWHSWICFKYGNKTFVFDPCLQIIVEKKIYYHMFIVSQIAGKATAKEVKEDLISKIKTNEHKDFRKKAESVAKFVPRKYAEKGYETLIIGNGDVNSPMYENSTGYIATIKDNEIIELIAFYYL